MEKERKGLSIASMVLGIVAIALFCLMPISIICATCAVTFGVIGINKCGKGMAIAGITLGIIAVLITVVIYIIPTVKENSYVENHKSGMDIIMESEDGEPFGFFSNTNSKNIAQAKENTKKYIEYKYGFTPEIISVDVDVTDHGITIRTGYSYVKAKYNGKEFNVVIPSNRESVKGADNYQSEEIKNAVLKMVTEEVSMPYSYEISYVSDISKNLKSHYAINYVQDYYDGNNLKEIINNNEFCVELSYLEDVDLKKLEKPSTNSLFACNLNIVIGKFKSKEVYDVFSESEKLIGYSFGYYYEKYLIENAMYLDEAFLKNIYEDEYKVDNQYYKFDMIEKDGIYFYAENMENIKIEKTQNIDWNEFADQERIVKHRNRITDDYIISGVEGDLYIYLPKSEYDWNYLFSLNSENTFKIDKGSEIADYLSFYVDLDKGNNRIAIFGW